MGYWSSCHYQNILMKRQFCWPLTQKGCGWFPSLKHGASLVWSSSHDSFDTCRNYGNVHEYGIDLEGKNAVVIGRSNIVGKPMAQLLLAKNATVTLTHSRTHNLAKVGCKSGYSCGRNRSCKFVTADFIKPGAVVIDVWDEPR